MYYYVENFRLLSLTLIEYNDQKVDGIFVDSTNDFLKS